MNTSDRRQNMHIVTEIFFILILLDIDCNIRKYVDKHR